jgi:8-oxo-dGTP diphosphatase
VSKRSGAAPSGPEHVSECSGAAPSGPNQPHRIERRVAVVLLVDAHGRVLMQHRSPDQKVSPNQWAFPGGRVEAGEEPVATARRELFEETGIRADRLEPFWSGTRPSVFNPDGLVEVYAFCARTDATQDDVVLGEGQAMLFLTPEEARDRDLGITAELLLPMFLASPAYGRLRSAET